MLNASFEFRRLAAEGARPLVKAQIVFKDESRRDLSGDDIMDNTVCFSQHTSSQGSFDIGAAVVGSLSIKLNNSDSRFGEEDFSGARIIPSVGIEVGEGRVEWLRKGTYWIDQPSSYGQVISLSCEDSMVKFDVPYDDVPTKYPATAAVVAMEVCALCGVPLLSAKFANSASVVSIRPPDGCTCRDVLSWVAQITGNFCRMTADDRLEFAWYDPSLFDDEDWLDGEEFDDADPYASGSTADGGDFSDYSAGAAVDGGGFDYGKIVSIWAVASESICTDDVLVTGVRVVASDQETADGARGDKGETAMVGSAGYVLEISGNPLVAYGEAMSVAKRLAGRVVGLRFRPFDVSCIGDPMAEAGDACVVTDRLQNAHRSYLTSVVYKAGAYAAMSCSAEPPLRKSASKSGASTVALKKLEDGLRAESEARETAVQRLNDDLANSPGVYTTNRVESGAMTTYVHDKSSLQDSTFVWKMNSAGFGMSVDGGKTYAYGLDKWGNAILNTVYAIGIDASYIRSGSLVVMKGQQKLFWADVGSASFGWNHENSMLTNDGTLTVKRGYIGCFEITNTCIRSKRSSLTAANPGVYVGADGMSTGDGTRWGAMGSGAFYGGNSANSETGYVAYNVSYNKVGGVTIGGKSCIGLMTPVLGVGDWTTRTGTPTIYAGQSWTREFVTGFTSGGSVTVTPLFGTLKNVAVTDGSKLTGRYPSVKYVRGVSVSYKPPTSKVASITFKKGLMVSS